MGNFLKSLFSSSGTAAQTKKEQKDFDVFKYDGLRAMRIGQVRYAVKCYEEALKIKEDKEVLQFLAAAYASLNETDEALRVIARFVESEPDDIPMRLMRASLFFQMAREQEAIDECLRVIAIDAAQPAAWFLMGRAKRNCKDPDGAIADLTQAITLKDDYADAYLLRGEILFEAHQAEKALLDAGTLIALLPEDEAAYLLRGRIREHLGDMAAAADDYNKVVHLNPFNEDASLASALLLIKAEKPDAAIALFDELLELNPDLAQAYRGRAMAKRLKGDEKAALEDDSRANELDAAEKETTAPETKPTNFNEIYKGGIY
ncbi:MAG: tetratricopeptide repeat protein [Tannerellaceae bacterium]|jgi:tetratricopeptide (TPR) repeat protein|nr:tetratricopeptide repeat protein [Tannerellaceae bacterium]